MDNIAICSISEDFNEQARLCADQLSIPLLDQYPSDSLFSYLLVFSQNPLGYQLQLEFPGQSLNPVLVDFLDQKLQYRKNFGGGRQQEIARAAGLKRGYRPNILDGTAGLGKDAFVLANLECKITLCERHPVIHAMLADGLRRLNLHNELTGQKTLSIPLYQQNSRDHLKSNPESYDIIYLDPMYPHRTKSALVKKEMRVLRSLVGDDADFDNVLDTALHAAKNRVIVKRPKTASPLGTRSPSHSIESRKTRFDVYLTALSH